MEIELLALDDSLSGQPVPIERTPRWGSAVAFAAFGVVVVGLMVFPNRSDSPPNERLDQVQAPQPVAPVQAELASTEPGASLGEGRQPDAAGARWPQYPRDHGPQMSGTPPTGQPVVPAATGLSLLYVNTIGRPTIVDLESGRRQELDIAKGRSFDAFLIEQGQVVTTKGGRQARPLASDRAVSVVVYRPSAVERGAGSELQAPVLAGPYLCLDIDGCPLLRWTEASFSDGRDSVEPYDGDRFPQLAELFEHWRADGRFLVPGGVDGSAIRVPRPRPGTTIWVIDQP